MLTREGIWQIGDRLRELLEGGTVVVGNGNEAETSDDRELSGDQQASAPIDSVEVMGDFDDGPPRVVVRGTFGEESANFEWRERGIRNKDGVMIDRVVADQGRKVPGAIWTLEASIELGDGSAGS